MSYRDVLQAIQGRTVVVDGVSGVIRVRGVWPNQTIWHMPDDEGRRSEPYRRRQRLLHGNDWDTCLSSYPERLSEVILRILGEPEATRLASLSSYSDPEGVT